MKSWYYRNYVTLAMYTFGTPWWWWWWWYKCIETCGSDYNINIVEINTYYALLVEIKAINILCYYGIIINPFHFASPVFLSVWFICNISIIWQLIMKTYMTYFQPGSTTVFLIFNFLPSKMRTDEPQCQSLSWALNG